ncbi:MAG: phosphoadenosine phosphosulfate reductase [Chloroflexi bacterium]|nr:MAG: phosphoadenosine phosphosulfate reductase [Chloroflexota bacterium]
MNPPATGPQHVDIEALSATLDPQDPRGTVARALALFPGETLISFSGAEDVALIDMAAKSGSPYRVFTLDTGRLHPETLEFMELVRKRYQVGIEAAFPQPEAVLVLVREKGLFSFYADGHEECCRIRKVEPLRRMLAGAGAYITGQRQDQSPATRAAIPLVQEDPGFSTDPATPLIKFNPLAQWTSAQVWDYIREYDVPYNALHDRGFQSIGCAPCTRATNPGEHERAGRWSWEEATQKECGLHAMNVPGGGSKSVV